MLPRSSFSDYLYGKKADYDNFSDKNLSKQFIPYFETGQRIEVKMDIGGTLRGYVGVTTGWRPSFLLMLRSNSSGSCYLLNDKCKILKEINRYR